MGSHTIIIMESSCCDVIVTTILGVNEVFLDQECDCLVDVATVDVSGGSFLSQGLLCLQRGNGVTVAEEACFTRMIVYIFHCDDVRCVGCFIQCSL